MGDGSLHDLEVVALEDDLGNGVAFVSKVLHVIFYSKVVEAVDLVACLSVFLNDLIAFMVEFTRDLSRCFHDEVMSGICKMSHQGHQRGFSATDRSIEQDPFFEIDPILRAGFFVANEVDHEFVNNEFVFGIEFEVLSEAEFSHLLKIVP